MDVARANGDALETLARDSWPHPLVGSGRRSTNRPARHGGPALSGDCKEPYPIAYGAVAGGARPCRRPAGAGTVTSAKMRRLWGARLRVPLRASAQPLPIWCCGPAPKVGHVLACAAEAAVLVSVRSVVCWCRQTPGGIPCWRRKAAAKA